MILKGTPVAKEIKAQLANKASRCKSFGIQPKVKIVRVGDNPEDVAYESRVLKNCEETGIEAEVAVLDKKLSTEAMVSRLNMYSVDESVHGILMFRPLPPHMDEKAIGKAIRIKKDIDCMNPENLQKLLLGEKDAITPCTPEAVVRLLKYYEIPLSGKHVVIVNRSLVLGRPLALMLLAEDATVTVCHSRTENLKEITSAADIVVTGVGKARHFGPEYFSEKAVIIDVGINFDENGMCGDVDFEKVSGKVAAITPVPGGVGAVTSAVLLNHLSPRVNLGEDIL